MGISVKRIILTIILAVLFVIAFGWVIMMQNHATLVSSQSVDETLRREEFMQAKNDIEFASGGCRSSGGGAAQYYRRK